MFRRQPVRQVTYVEDAVAGTERFHNRIKNRTDRIGAMHLTEREV